MWWSRIVEKHPLLIIITVVIINWSLFLITFLSHSLPTFDDPLVGFEVRGTEISKRINAWKLLLESTSWNGLLSMYPKIEDQNRSPNFKSNNLTHFDDEEEMKQIEEMESNPFRSRNHGLGQNKAFCGKLFEDYAQFILESNEGNDLLSLNSLKTLCQIDKELLRMENSVHSFLFESNCEQKKSSDCCKSWSLVNYVALLSNKSSCDDIDQNDINRAKSHFELCAPYYHNLQLSDDCESEPLICRKAPKSCFKSENAVFNVMNYLVDYNFLNPKTPNLSKVKYTNIFLPIAKSSKLLPYFNQLSDNSLEKDNIRVVAMDLGLKHTLFDKYLLHDTIYLMIAFFLILLSLYVYTTSIIITIVTVITIVTSLATSYFFYISVFKMPFFPFMNLLTIVIAIGIGSDNTFIYCKVWECAKTDKTSVIFIKLIRDTLSHSWISIFTASITTCLAFFAGFFSDITSIKCFSVFASTSVIVNFIITMLSLPSAVILAERISFNCFSSFTLFWRIHSKMTSISKTFFEKMLFNMILKFRFIFILIFGGIAIYSILIVVYNPKLKLPDSEEFQIFSAKHYFEKYDFEYKNQFWFKRSKDKNDSNLYVMPIRVVFGVKAIDSGDLLNPYSRGSLELVEDFDISTESSQLWLIQFCKELRNQSFYRPTIGPLLSNCFIETFKSWIDDRRCVDGINHNLNRSPCCETSVFPYEPNVFNLCLHKVIELLHKTPNYFLNMDWSGPRFDKKSLKIVAAVIEYDSNYSFSHSFVEMNNFWNAINDWVTNKMKTAPKELRNGWFISSGMEFFALQLSLSEGTIKSIVFAVIFSFIALFLTTWNIKLSALSTITISCIIFTTIAILVLLNWKLNILESISISLAIGLAIDLTLHYTIAFKLSTQENNINGIHYALCRIASPVAMAAITTLLAGISMLFSSILAYVQIGTFLIILSFISWTYSTIFHLCLLSIFGSQKTIIKTDPLVYCCLLCNDSNNTITTVRSTTLESISSDFVVNNKKNKSSILQTFSVSTISSSSPTNSSAFQFQNHSESHELEKMIQ